MDGLAKNKTAPTLPQSYEGLIGCAIPQESDFMPQSPASSQEIKTKPRVIKGGSLGPALIATFKAQEQPTPPKIHVAEPCRAIQKQLLELSETLSARQWGEGLTKDENLAARGLIIQLEKSKNELLGVLSVRSIAALFDSEDELGDYELWRDRKDKKEKPIDFLRRVHGAKIEAGLLFQMDISGQKKTKTNLNPLKGLDKTLYFKLVEQCKDEGIKLSSVLPSYIKKPQTPRYSASFDHA